MSRRDLLVKGQRVKADEDEMGKQIMQLKLWLMLPCRVLECKRSRVGRLDGKAVEDLA